MDNTSLTKLKNQYVIVAPDIAHLFEIYSKNIRSQIATSGNLSIHQKISLAKSTLYIRADKKLQLVNNFELYHLIKHSDIDQQLLSQNLLVGVISKEQFCIKYAFYELIEVIAKYQKQLNIELIYKQLDKCLTLDMKQQIFEKNVFAAATFCKLINVQEQTYYNRCKGRVKNAEF